MRRLALASLCLVLAADSPAIERMRRDILALTAQDMEGRGHASPGLQKAAAFVASELKKMGLQAQTQDCLLYTSPSPRDGLLSRMPSSA